MIHYLLQPHFMWRVPGRGYLLSARVSTELETEGCTLRSKTRRVLRALPIHSDSSYIQGNSSRTADSQSVTISLNTLHVTGAGEGGRHTSVDCHRAGLSVCMGRSEVGSHKGPVLSASALRRYLKSSASANSKGTNKTTHSSLAPVTHEGHRTPRLSTELCTCCSFSSTGGWRAAWCEAGGVPGRAVGWSGPRG